MILESSAQKHRPVHETRSTKSHEMTRNGHQGLVSFREFSWIVSFSANGELNYYLKLSRAQIIAYAIPSA